MKKGKKKTKNYGWRGKIEAKGGGEEEKRETRKKRTRRTK